MINLYRALKNERLLHALTSLNWKAFDELVSIWRWSMKVNGLFVDRNGAIELLFDGCSTFDGSDKSRAFSLKILIPEQV